MFHEYPFLTGGLQLNVAADAENGPPLHFFHGVCRCWQDYGAILPTFASRFWVHSVDHRGHGRSHRASRYQVADYVADAITLVRAYERPAVLAGHSLGALVALGVAAAAPEHVRGIVLEDPPSANFIGRLDAASGYAIQFRAMRELAGNRDTKSVAQSLANIRYPDGSRMGDRRDAASIRFLARCVADLDPEVLTPILERRWLGDFDPLAVAAGVKCPALVLAADSAQGGMLSADDAAQMAAALPDATRVNCPGVGHQIHGTRPDLYLQLTMNFLDSLT